MSRNEEARRRGIERAAVKYREAAQKGGATVTHSQAVDRVRAAVVKQEKRTQE